jgi:hypothetical protein
VETVKNWKIIKIHFDQVRGGYNVDLHRQNIETGQIIANRIARFGGELCDNPEDQKLAEKLFSTCLKTMSKYIDENDGD